MATAIRLSYAQGWKNTKALIMEEWIVTIAEFAEIAKLTCLVKMGITITFIKDRTHFMDTLLKWIKIN